MKKGDKIFLTVAGILAVIVLLFVLRYKEIIGVKYHNIELDGEYTQIQCIRHGKEVMILTEPEEIAECVAKVKEFQVRDADWFDTLLGKDGKTPKGYLGGCSQLVLVFTDKEGQETELSFPQPISKGGDMNYIRGLFQKK